MSFQENELLLASALCPDGLRRSELSVPSIHCGGCIKKIETAIAALPSVKHARVNLSTKRVTVVWNEEYGIPKLQETLKNIGFDAFLTSIIENKEDKTFKKLVRALAVSGFAAGNIMMLSMSVWFGATNEARDLFHLISAIIALPTLIYAGQTFFASAFNALMKKQTNMDVPISVGLILTFSMSLYDTIVGGEHAYFDAAVMLLFFLLIGRTLDYLMREKARSAVKGLQNLSPRGALVINPDQSQIHLPLNNIEIGMHLLVKAGERIPVNGHVLTGTSQIDLSLVNGETISIKINVGSELVAGTLNLTGPLIIEATSTAETSFLADMIRLMEVAEKGKATYRRIADRMAQLYSPFVHSIAFIAFLFWMLLNGDIHHSLTIGISLLIITCPCALGLAVPMVQVMASKKLFENGILVKDGTALERLNEIDTILFDKTGTLTLNQPILINKNKINPDHLLIARNIGLYSNHPYCLALSNEGLPKEKLEFDKISEYSGDGIEAIIGNDVYRLGKSEWALAEKADQNSISDVTLSLNSQKLETFQFEDQLRPSAERVIKDLQVSGFSLEILSGDKQNVVWKIAKSLGIENFKSSMRPEDKMAYISSFKNENKKVLMVGDGLNDVPALAAAHVSIAPANAVDVGRNAADFVFMRKSLESIPLAIKIARDMDKLIKQNFVLAILYNIIAIPFAFMGYVTPLYAAIAMSLSSILVVVNALRLGWNIKSNPNDTKSVSVKNRQQSKMVEA